MSDSSGLANEQQNSRSEFAARSRAPSFHLTCLHKNTVVHNPRPPLPIARRRPSCWFARLAPLVLAFLLHAGCGSGHTVYPVEPDTAKQSLELVLNGWKEGKPIDNWLKASPEIIVQDADWSMGRKLIGFEIVKGEPIDANLHSEVKLTLDMEGKPTPKTVTYLVGTKPVITVFRKFGP